MKEFGISYRQFLDEPLDVVMISIKIRDLLIEREERESDRAKRLSRMNNG